MCGSAQYLLAVNRTLLIIYRTGLMTISSLNVTWGNPMSLRGETCETWPNKGLGGCLPAWQEGPFLLLLLLFPGLQQVQTDQAPQTDLGRCILRDKPKVQKHFCCLDGLCISIPNSLKKAFNPFAYVHDCKPVCIWGKDSECDPIPVHFTYFYLELAAFCHRVVINIVVEQEAH